MIKKMQLTILVGALVVAAMADKATAGEPLVTGIMVTDVTPRSFPVIWTSSEASTPDLELYDDPDGFVPTLNAVAR